MATFRDYINFFNMALTAQGQQVAKASSKAAMDTVKAQAEVTSTANRLRLEENVLRLMKAIGTFNPVALQQQEVKVLQAQQKADAAALSLTNAQLAKQQATVAQQVNASPLGKLASTFGATTFALNAGAGGAGTPGAGIGAAGANMLNPGGAAAQPNQNQIGQAIASLANIAQLAARAAAGDPVAAGQLLYEATVGLVYAFKDLNRALYEANMEFRKFSGHMASVYANQLTREIELSRDRGDRRARSAEYHAQNMHELNKTLSIYEDALAIYGNYAMGFWSKVAEGLLKAGMGPVGQMPGGPEAMLAAWEEALARVFGAPNVDMDDTVQDFLHNRMRVEDVRWDAAKRIPQDDQDFWDRVRGRPPRMGP